MGLLTRATVQITNPRTPAYWLQELFGGKQTAAGNRVTEDLALTYVAFYACVNKISKTVATLPFPVYKRLDPRGKEKARAHPLYRVLHDRSNPEMTAPEFWYTIMGHLLTWHNSYANIVRNNAGQVMELWPIPPNRMAVKRDPKTKKLIYKVTMHGEPDRLLFDSEVLHLHGFSKDGIMGERPAIMFKETIGQGLAENEFGSRLFSNGAQPGGVLTHPGKLNDTAFENLKKSWQDAQQGLSNAHRTAILEDGVTWNKIGLSPMEAQMLEAKKFTVIEICRIYDMPPHKIQEMSAATYTNIEQGNIEYGVDTILPWTVFIKLAVNTELFLPSEQDQYFAEQQIEGLLKGDTAAQTAFFASGKQWGYLNTNDVRDMINRNPVDGGDEFMMPLNMIPMSQVGVAPPKAPSPIPPARASGHEQETREALQVKELRTRFLNHRAKIKNQFKPLIEDIGTRVFKREKADIMRRAEKVLKSRSVDDLLTWLDSFYKDLPDYIQTQARATYQSFIQALNESASIQVGIDPATAEQISQWADTYSAGMAQNYSIANLGTLRSTLITAQEGGTDPLEALSGQMDTWATDRPAQLFAHESTFVACAVAGATWQEAGFSEEVWVADGAACPICQDMDGVTTAIDATFVGAGSMDYGDGQTTEIHRDIIHPPLHDWPGQCACDVAPA